MRPSARLVVFVSAFAAAGAAHAQPPASSTNSTPKRPVLFSASGGISRGAYQGGVDWTLSEFLRRQRSEAFRERLGVPEEFELGSATGASAGNINALFAAMALVHGRDSTDIGPSVCDGDRRRRLAVLEDVGQHRHPRALTAGLTEQGARGPRPRVLRDGAPPVGRGLPRQRDRPRRVRPTGGADVDQAHANRSVARRRRDQQGHRNRAAFRFDLPSDYRRPTAHLLAAAREQADAGRLGALALLPALRYSPLDDWEARLEAVFNVVLASSSFPVAFAPREVKYELGGLRMPGTPSSVETAQFSDGGVFDNNPLGLSWGLFELEREARKQTLDPTARVMVAYSSPGTYRGALDKARRPGPNGQERTGLGAAVQLVGGAIASARQYELQAFARQMDRDEKLKSRRQSSGCRREPSRSSVRPCSVSARSSVGRSASVTSTWASTTDWNLLPATSCAPSGPRSNARPAWSSSTSSSSPPTRSR